MWEDCDDVLEWNIVVSEEFICMMESLYVGLVCKFSVRAFAVSFTETWAIYLSTLTYQRFERSHSYFTLSFRSQLIC